MLTIWFWFFITIGSINVIGSSIMTSSSFKVKSCSFTKCLSSLWPLFGHLVKICSSLVAFDSFIDFWRPTLTWSMTNKSVKEVNKNCVKNGNLPSKERTKKTFAGVQLFLSLSNKLGSFLLVICHFKFTVNNVETAEYLTFSTLNKTAITFSTFTKLRQKPRHLDTKFRPEVSFTFC